MNTNQLVEEGFIPETLAATAADELTESASEGEEPSVSAMHDEPLITRSRVMNPSAPGGVLTCASAGQVVPVRATEPEVPAVPKVPMALHLRNAVQAVMRKVQALWGVLVTIGRMAFGGPAAPHLRDWELGAMASVCLLGLAVGLPLAVTSAARSWSKPAVPSVNLSGFWAQDRSQQALEDAKNDVRVQAALAAAKSAEIAAREAAAAAARASKEAAEAAKKPRWWPW